MPQYVVFIIRLILSYLPVHQLISLPSSPLTSVAVVELLGEGERPGYAQGGLPDVRDRQLTLTLMYNIFPFYTKDKMYVACHVI